MNILLDSNILLWSLFEDEQLSAKTKNLISNSSNTIYVSVVSLWEIEIKHQKHKELMPYSFEDIYKIIDEHTDYIFLDLCSEQIGCLKDIMKQNIHSDPFDQMLLSVAKKENVRFLTNDSVLKKYQSDNLEVILN